MTAADLQSLAARIQPYHVGAGCDLFVTVPWTEWQAVLEQAQQALTLEECNRNLQAVLTLHENSHVTMTVERANELEEAEARLFRLEQAE